MNRRRLSNSLVKGSVVISSHEIQKFSELRKKELITYRHPNSNQYALPWMRLVEEGGGPKCGDGEALTRSLISSQPQLLENPRQKTVEL